MKHPRFKGTKVLDLEVEKCEHNLSQKEIEFHWALKQLKNADPDKDDIHKLRKVFRSKEKQVIKARRQLKSKQSQKTNKLNERNGIKNGGIAKKRERLALNKALTQEMREQEGILSQLKNTKIEFSSEAATEKIGTDLFISHASEDKDDFVRDLADELISQGVSVWYDEYTLKIGDRLRRSIDKGLSESKYGLIVISKSFIKKDWPQYELDGL
jgi:signal recognition particle GTPase